MKRAVGILSIALAPLFVAGLALADDRYGGSGAEPRGTGAGSAPAGTPSTGSMGGFMGQHMMTGTVTDIDADEGKITVNAEGKDLDLHFPRSALQGLKKGDRVTVQLAIRQAGTSGATSGMGGGAGTGTGAGGGPASGAGPAGGPSSGAGYPGGAGSGPSTR